MAINVRAVGETSESKIKFDIDLILFNLLFIYLKSTSKFR